MTSPRSGIWIPAAAGLLAVLAVHLAWSLSRPDPEVEEVAETQKNPPQKSETEPPTPRLPPISFQNLDGANPEELFGAVCANCHGHNGEGNPVVKAPSIAGMPAWYVQLQIDKFRRGTRGGHGEDIEGAQMRAIAATLHPDWIEPVANHVASLKPFATESTVGGESEFAVLIYEQRCMACHRYNGQGERVFRSAPLTNLNDWYIASQLRKFRSGVRGSDSGLDHDAWKMHEQAKLLSDQAILDMAAYIAEMAQTYPPGQRRARVRRTYSE